MLQKLFIIFAALSLAGLVTGLPTDASAQGKSGEKGESAQKDKRSDKADKAKKRGESADEEGADEARDKRGSAGDKSKKAREKAGEKADGNAEKGLERAKEAKASDNRPDKADRGPNFDQKTTKELEKHAERIAKINRIRKIAEEKDNEKLYETANKLEEKERDRHTRTMKGLGHKMELAPGESGNKGGTRGVASDDKGGDQAEKAGENKAKKDEKARGNKGN